MVYDPAAMRRSRQALSGASQMRYATDAYEVAEDAHALLILTDWQEFAQLDLDRIRNKMRFPLVVDGRNLFSPEAMRARGFTYFSTGRPPVHPLPAEDLAIAV